MPYKDGERTIKYEVDEDPNPFNTRVTKKAKKPKEPKDGVPDVNAGLDPGPAAGGADPLDPAIAANAPYDPSDPVTAMQAMLHEMGYSMANPLIANYLMPQAGGLQAAFSTERAMDPNQVGAAGAGGSPLSGPQDFRAYLQNVLRGGGGGVSGSIQGALAQAQGGGLHDVLRGAFDTAEAGGGVSTNPYIQQWLQADPTKNLLQSPDMLVALIQTLLGALYGRGAASGFGGLAQAGWDAGLKNFGANPSYDMFDYLFGGGG